MPIYQYECKSCKHTLEEHQNVQDEPLVKCPSCQKKKLFRVVTGGLGFYMANRTVGAIADKNTGGFSEDFKLHLKEKNKTKKKDNLSKKLPDGAEIQPTPKSDVKINKKLINATTEQKAKYIETGKI